jgi:uncharacterized BrkB/YihY/UPF0761 family membrane protein
MKKGENKDNSFGVSSVILGILSIVLASANGMGIILGIIGIVFSKKQEKIGKNKWSKAGFILNLIGIILGIVLLTVFIIYILKNPELYENLTNA